MTKQAYQKVGLYKKYSTAINYRSLISMAIAILATWISFEYCLIFNLDLTLISVAVVFPLVFTLGSAFQRRERALEHLGRTKGALAAIKFSFSYSKKISDEKKIEINATIKDVKTQLIKFLYYESNDKKELKKAISNIQKFVTENRDGLSSSLSLKVYRLMRDVIMGIENAISIKTHRTPQSIRAYCELFIYVFPFFYAPTLIKNIVYQDALIIDILNHTTPNIEIRYLIIVYALNMVLSFFLITLFNVQEQIENPFDQYGMDDIKLVNYELDY